MRRMQSVMRRAIEDYGMIEEGDRIAVGLSGGKDSVAMLAVLWELSKYYPKRCQVEAISLDLGLAGFDFSAVSDFCAQRGIPLTVIKTDIAPIIFDIRKESNPCSLCAKLRRGALHTAAKEHGCNKVALGHHFDDVVETFFLSLFFEGRISCFSPVTYLDKMDLTLIRPMIYVPEKEIRGFVRREGLPVAHNPCPADGNTKREYIKKLIADLDYEHRHLKEHVFGALQRSGIAGWKESQVGRRTPLVRREPDGPAAGSEAEALPPQA